MASKKSQKGVKLASKKSQKGVKTASQKSQKGVNMACAVATRRFLTFSGEIFYVIQKKIVTLQQ